MAEPLPSDRFDEDGFLAWLEGADPRFRYELVNGRIVAMGRGNAAHSNAMVAIVNALNEAISRRRVNCRAFAEGLAVRAGGPDNIRLPDVVVQCGPMGRSDTVVRNPVIVVEILPSESAYRDTMVKPRDYGLNASVAHYLIADPNERSVQHYRRLPSGDLLLTPSVQGRLDLTPPGIDVDIDAFFEDGGFFAGQDE